MKRHTIKMAGVLVLATALLCSPVGAERVEVATANLTSGGLDWNVNVAYDGLKLVVAGEGRYFAQTFEAGEAPSFALFDAEGEALADGTYKWELTVLPKLTQLDRADFENRRANADGSREWASRAPERQVAYGTFTIAGGAIVTDDSSEESGTLTEVADSLLTEVTDEVIFHSGDGSITGSLCVGFDCISSEAFGFDTIRLKENNLRIKFQDTSSTGSFPSNDWQLTANDSANGGANKFSIDDVDSGRTPFTIEAGAPSHALFVEDSGEVGFGTSTPLVELHVVEGDSPTLRLEQDGSSGFTPQTWDVAGNESNFFVRDATNGSKLPFRIRPGAPSNSIFVDSDGDVGLGTASPERELHVFRAGDPSNLKVEGTGAGIILESTAAPADERTAQIFVSSAGDFRMRGLTDSGGQSVSGITVDLATGNVGINETTPSGTLDVNGTIFLSGSQIHPDYVFQPGYEVEPIEEHSARMWEKGHLPALAPARYREDGKRVIELGANTAGMLEELEIAHLYIEQLHERLARLEAELAEQ